jgi:hypothetical protein
MARPRKRTDAFAVEFDGDPADVRTQDPAKRGGTV